MTVPVVRSPLTKSILEQLDRQLPHVQAAIRAQAASTIRRIEEASRVDWIPLSVQLDLFGAFHDHLSEKAYDTLCMGHFTSTLEQPLVRGMFDTTVRLFGLGPAPIFRAFAKTWGVISRGCGELTAEENGAGQMTLFFRDLPMEEERIDLFVVGFRATFRGVIEVARARGDVELVSFDRTAREAIYRAHWSASA